MRAVWEVLGVADCFGLVGALWLDLRDQAPTREGRHRK